MQVLLENYSIGEIVMFIVILAISIKSVVTFFDWCTNRLRKIFKQETDEEKVISEINEKLENDNRRINELVQNQSEILSMITKISGRIDILVESDKDDIKSFIVKEHHRFCYDEGWIDDYSMDAIEKRFKHYQDEGGNSYVEELMKDLRVLKHEPNHEQQQD